MRQGLRAHRADLLSDLLNRPLESVDKVGVGGGSNTGCDAGTTPSSTSNTTPDDVTQRLIMQSRSLKQPGKAVMQPKSGNGKQEEQLQALLDRLDAKDAADNGKSGRRSARITYRRSGVGLLVHHPGGSITERTVLTRDLSAGGLSFIHGGYLHVGTRCDVTLNRYIGGEDTVRGQVQHCDHIAGSWHTVGVKFDRRIFPKLYLDPENANVLEVDARNPQTVSGRVLLLDDNELDRRLMQHHLRRTKIELTGVSKLSEACEALANQSAKNPFVLAIVDLNLAGDEADVPAEEVVRRVLDVAVPRVAACTAESNQETLRRVREAGACGILSKPYDAEKLIASVAGWLANSGGASSDGEKIHSTVSSQAEMRPMVVDFVNNAASLCSDLQSAVTSDNLAKCRALCVSLRGGGTSFGFTPVTEAAAEAVVSLDATMSVAEAAVAIQRLQDICSRLSGDPEGETEDDVAMAA